MQSVSSPQRQTDIRGRDPRMLVALLAVAVVFSYCDRLVLNLLIEPIRHDLLLTDTQFSVLQGASFGLVFATANPLLAWLSDHASRRWILVGGMTLWSLATMACGVVSTYGQMLGVRALIGLGEAALIPTAIALVCEYFPPGHRRAAAIGVLLTSAGIGPGVGVLIGGIILKSVEAGMFVSPALIGSFPPWRIVLILIGIPPLIIAAVVLVMLKSGRTSVHESAASTSNESVTEAPRLLLKPLVWGYVAASFYMIAQWAELSWVPALLIRRHGLDAATAGDVFGGVTITTGLLGPLIAVRLSDRLRQRLGLGGRFVAPALGLLLSILVSALLLSPNKYLVIAATVLLDLGIFVAACAFIICLPDFLSNRHTAFATSLVYFLSGFLGLGVAPTLVALATDRIYGDDAAVGKALVTVILPALIFAAAAFAGGVRSIRGAAEDHPTMTGEPGRRRA